MARTDHRNTEKARAIISMFSQAEYDAAVKALGEEASQERLVDWILTKGALAMPPLVPAVAVTEDEMLKRAIELSAQEANNPNKRHAGGTSTSRQQEEEEMISRVVEMSIKTAGVDSSQVDPDNPHRRKRDGSTPVGLKNTGNTCYFNSLLQLYFYLRPQFFELIMKCPAVKEQPPPSDSKQPNSAPPLTEVAKAKMFFWEFQSLFAGLHKSKRKFLDASKAVDALFKFGDLPQEVGAQQDVVEVSGLITKAIETAFAAYNYEPHAIKNVFTALVSQQVTATHPITQQPVVQTADVELKDIMLSIDSGDLYSALDHYTHSHIDSYKLENQVTQATQELWFQHFPSVLSFQLKRAAYDVEKKEVVKLNSEFTFDKDIFMDRYLIQHKAETTRRRAILAGLQAKRDAIAAELNSFTHYNNSTIDLLQSLQAVSHFLGSDNPIVAGSADLAATRNQLSTISAKVQQRVATLQSQLADAKKQVDAVFQDMNRVGYTLFAAFIHEGRQAGSGHYWAFIRDFQNDRWLKFNDAKVSVETEETVWNEARGGHLNASATFLVYKRTADIANFPPTYDESIPALTPVLHTVHWDDDNAKFEKELRDYDEKQKASRIESSATALVADYTREAKELTAVTYNASASFPASEPTTFHNDQRIRSFPAFLQCVGRNHVASQQLLADLLLSLKPARGEHRNAILSAASTKLVTAQQFIGLSLHPSTMPLTAEQKAAEGKDNPDAVPDVAFELEFEPHVRSELTSSKAEFNRFISITHVFVAGLERLYDGRVRESLDFFEAAYFMHSQLTAQAFRKNEIAYYTQLAIFTLFVTEIMPKLRSASTPEPARTTAFNLMESITAIAVKMFENESHFITFLRETWVAHIERNDHEAELGQPVTMMLLDNEGPSAGAEDPMSRMSAAAKAAMQSTLDAVAISDANLPGPAVLKEKDRVAALYDNHVRLSARLQNKYAPRIRDLKLVLTGKPLPPAPEDNDVPMSQAGPAPSTVAAPPASVAVPPPKSPSSGSSSAHATPNPGILSPGAQRPTSPGSLAPYSPHSASTSGPATIGATSPSQSARSTHSPAVSSPVSLAPSAAVSEAFSHTDPTNLPRTGNSDMHVD